MIVISHTHEDGTVVDGTRKGDGVGDILKANGFIWRYGAWRLRGSRDRMANDWTIQRAAEALRAAGFEVTVEVDNTPRSFAEAEAERVERAEGRAGRFAGYAGNAAGRRDGAEARFHEIQEHIPLGQPILVGHHSEGRHRRDIARMERSMETAADESRKAQHWEGRAAAAESYQQHRENVSTTIRRIERLEADRRDVARRLDSGRASEAYVVQLNHRATQLDDEIAHWRRHVEAAKAAGVKVWTSEDFAKGDFIQCGGPRWHRVVRANKRTLSVENPTSPALKPLPLPYDKVTGRRSAEQMDATQGVKASPVAGGET